MPLLTIFIFIRKNENISAQSYQLITFLMEIVILLFLYNMKILCILLFYLFIVNQLLLIFDFSFWQKMGTDLRSQLCDKPENYINDPTIELQWAEKAFKKAGIHTNLIFTSDTKQLKLCKEQDQILERFRKDFPSIDVSNVRELLIIVICLVESGGPQRRSYS